MAAPIQLVRCAAEALSIDLRDPQQLHLLAVANAYLLLPLPTSWKRVVDGRGLLFLDRRYPIIMRAIVLQG